MENYLKDVTLLGNHNTKYDTSVTYISQKLRSDVETRKEIESKVQELNIISHN